MASVSKDAHVAKPATHGMFRDFWMGGLASSLATLVSNPIEVCKTRLQLEGELQTKQAEKNTRRYRGMFNAFTTIARTEGIRGLQGGLSAAVRFIVSNCFLVHFHIFHFLASLLMIPPPRPAIYCLFSLHLIYIRVLRFRYLDPLVFSPCYPDLLLRSDFKS